MNLEDPESQEVPRNPEVPYGCWSGQPLSTIQLVMMAAPSSPGSRHGKR